MSAQDNRHSKQHSFSSQQQFFNEQRSRQGSEHLHHMKTEQAEAEKEEMRHPAKTLQFGSLIEQHMGSLDLKKEMEKLKQLDEEQKRQKKISLRIQPHPTNPLSAT